MNLLPSYLKESKAGCTLTVKLQPRSSKNEICGQLGDALKIKVTAPPVDSAANQTLVEFLSKTLSLPKSAVILIKGQTSRNKILQLNGITAEEFLSKIIS